jgi:exodeoxyribonuclease V gamma subunit
LPHGAAGEVVFNTVRREAEGVVAHLRTLAAPGGFQRRSLALPLEGFRISADLALSDKGEQVVYRFAKSRGRDLIAAWVRHLMWCALSENPGADKVTWLINRDAVRQIKFSADAAEQLGVLLELYFEAGHIPLPLFPQASFVYGYQRFARRQTEARALQAAQTAWTGSLYHRGDADDPYIGFCFRGLDPFDRGFAEVTSKVFAPLWAHMNQMPQGES